MSKKFKIGIGAMVVAVLLSALMAGAVFAQDDGTTPSDEALPERMERMGKALGMRGRGMMGDNAGMQAIADLLGMTTEDLFTAFKDGQTLEDLAEAAGLDVETLKEAAQAANEQAMREAIEQSVVDGDRTREHADWLLEGLDNGYIGGGRDAGCFDRMGGKSFGQRGSFERPQRTPKADSDGETTTMSGRFQRVPNAGSEAL